MLLSFEYNVVIVVVVAEEFKSQRQRIEKWERKRETIKKGSPYLVGWENEWNEWMNKCNNIKKESLMEFIWSDPLKWRQNWANFTRTRRNESYLI